MLINNNLKCTELSCADIDAKCFIKPEIEIDCDKVSIIMISECAPEHLEDYFYSNEKSLFEETTVQAFNDAGADVSNIQEILDLGVYLTTAIKCRKTEYVIKTSTINECSILLEKELSQFRNIKAYMLMGDAAIKSLNSLARRTGEKRIIPPGSTYKIRGKDYYYKGCKVFPSYLQAGPSFYIEKSKREMIAEDIASALSYLNRQEH